MKRLTGLMLILTLLAQWLLPAQQIFSSQRILRDGQRYYFRTAPVDPVDAFRGRYVALDYLNTRVPLSGNAFVSAGMSVYVPLTRGSDGFAVLGAASLQPPAQGDFLIASIAELNADHSVRLRLPFDRYYLTESDAPRIDAHYRDVLRSGGRVYVAVRIRDGRARLEELFIDDVPVRSLLQP